MARRDELVLDFLASVGIHLFEKFRTTFSFDVNNTDERRNKHRYDITFSYEETDRSFQVMIVGYVKALIQEALERNITDDDLPATIFDTFRFSAKKFSLSVVDAEQHHYQLSFKYRRMMHIIAQEEDDALEEGDADADEMEFPEVQEEDAYWGSNPLLFARAPVPVPAPAPVIPVPASASAPVVPLPAPFTTMSFQFA